ncbi:MAG: class II aldolase/adducin family protein, partial [Rhodoplanes sp.]
MHSRYVERDAEAIVARYAGEGVVRDIALRVYTTRLLGQDPKLVRHGGGNTSVKTRLTDLVGTEVEALCVKGSGLDMAAIEPLGFAAVRLAPLRSLRARAMISDRDLLQVQRANLIDPTGPNPSVEMLLHAFLPAKFIDHTHANAVLSLIDQPDGGSIAAEVFGERVDLVPYVRPGFGLAKAAAEVFERRPQVQGLILDKHGIFTFGDTAREAYERMIEMVSAAEARLRRGRKPIVAARLPDRIASATEVMPIIRGACSAKDESAEGAFDRPILDFRTGPAILDFVGGAELKRCSQAGVVTPDYSIRTKNWPLVLDPPVASELAAFREHARAAVQTFVARYRDYFARNNARVGGGKRMLDPLPRVVLVPGLGLLGLGRSKKDAIIAADLAEASAAVISDAEAIGRFQSISEADMFDMEYWPPEQAKL